MKVHSSTAARALALIDSGLTPAQAAHDCGISLQSIRPYTDARTEAVKDLCEWLARKTPERLPACMDRLREIAGK